MIFTVVLCNIYMQTHTFCIMYIHNCRVYIYMYIHIHSYLYGIGPTEDPRELSGRRYLPLRRDQRGVGRGGGNDGMLAAVLRRKANKILENMVSVGLFLLGVE